MMIKRKNGVTTMVIVIIMFIVSAVPVFAASYLNVSDDFVIEVENPTKEPCRVILFIDYQDENGNTLYNKILREEVEAFETRTIDAKDYYNSEKTKKVAAIGKLVELKIEKLALYWAIGAATFFVLFTVLAKLDDKLDCEVLGTIAYICIIASLISLLVALCYIYMLF